MDEKIDGKKIDGCATMGSMYDQNSIIVWGKKLKRGEGQIRINVNELLPLIRKRKWEVYKAKKHTYLSLP